MPLPVVSWPEVEVKRLEVIKVFLQSTFKHKRVNFLANVFFCELIRLAHAQEQVEESHTLLGGLNERYIKALQTRFEIPLSPPQRNVCPVIPPTYSLDPLLRCAKPSHACE